MFLTHLLVFRAQGQEYVEQYRLQYQREDDGRWFTFHNRRGQQVTQRQHYILTSFYWTCIPYYNSLSPTNDIFVHCICVGCSHLGESAQEMSVTDLLKLSQYSLAASFTKRFTSAALLREAGNHAPEFWLATRLAPPFVR